MNKLSNQAMESALIDTVNKELAIMESMCDADFPCDSGTTLAMRMSRAVVLSIVCSLESLESDDHAIPDELETLVNEAKSKISHLSEQYAEKLAGFDVESIERHIWRI